MGYQVLDVNKFIGKGPIPFEVYDRNGQPTGEIVNIDIGAMVNTGKLALKYIEKLSPAFKTYLTKITWTIDYRCPTACTDGIRVFINPIFAYQMICRCNDNIMDSYRKHKNSGPGWQKNFIKEHGVNGVFNSVKEITDFYRYRSVTFIILHEIYHQIYRHIQQEKRKPETRNGDEATHDLANMAMDAEINRDIEWQFEELKGCTEEVPGITDGMTVPKYKKWAWNTIFDDYVLQGKQAAARPIVPQAIKRGDPNQKQQQNGQGGRQPQDKPEERTATESYAKGWNQAIADYKSGAVDPNTFKELPVDESKFGTVKPPKINQDEYNQGYNDAMNDMYNRLNGLNGNDGQGGKGAKFSNLDENPIPQQGGGGQGNDDQSQNNQQKQQNQQNQSGQGQGGNQQQQNQNGQQQNGGQQGQQNQNGQNGQQQGGQNGQQQNQQGQGGGGSQSGQQNGQNQNGQGQGG